MKHVVDFNFIYVVMFIAQPTLPAGFHYKTAKKENKIQS